jgi:hypothetical protein
MAKKSRLGWLGPAIFIIGAVIAAFLIWFMQSVKPEAGAEIDRIAIGGSKTIVLRKEAHGDRSMIELHDGNKLAWQALIPHYAGAPGRPAIAWSDKAVTVRVERDGRAEVFAFALGTAQKLGAYRIAPEHEPITTQPQGPITMTDHRRAYELVGGLDWHQLVAVDLDNGNGLWKVDLGRDAVTAGGVDAATVWIEQGGHRRAFATPDGKPLN